MTEIQKVITIAREAGMIVKKYYKTKSYSVSTKSGPTDYVTTADLASEAHIKKRLTELFPADTIFSEEDTNRPTNFSGRVWFVDPLDGTLSFVARQENFTVLIGLCEKGKPVLGVVYSPLSGELFYAEKNKGAWMLNKTQKKKIKVSTIHHLTDARVMVSTRPLTSSFKKMMTTLPCKEVSTRGDGMCGCVSCLIAQGKAECRVNVNVSKWDTCGPQVILEEAGGKMTDIDGNALDYAQKEVMWERSVVATNKLIHEEVITHLQKELHKKENK